MCDPAVLNFARRILADWEVEGKSVLDVGSRQVQLCYDECSPEESGLREILLPLNPSRYVGVDILAGTGVDEIVSVYDLASRFGDDSFDIVVCTEVVEHVEDWRRAFSNLKRVTKPGGLLIITTRSPGFAYHGWPHDYWRFTVTDFVHVMRDYDQCNLVHDTFSPGVLYAGIKPVDFTEADLGGHALPTAFRGRRRLRAPSRPWRYMYVAGLWIFRVGRRFGRRVTSLRTKPSPL
jgi:SAM-dependent methyltransferase